MSKEPINLNIDWRGEKVYAFYKLIKLIKEKLLHMSLFFINSALIALFPYGYVSEVLSKRKRYKGGY